MRSFPSRINLCVGMAAAALLAGMSAAAGDSPARPKLVVLLVFDQMRGDYFGRWGHLFPDGGFRRLLDGGAWYQNCHYPYAMTMTAAGHASLSTGAFPSTHGIVGNDWFEPAIGQTVYATANDRWQLRLWTDTPVRGDQERPGGSPERLLAATFGDVVKEKYGDRSKVISLSVKDRSAILMGGRSADACYWMDGRTGLAATSSYYGDRIHSWVKEFNNRRPADQWLGKSWERLRDDVDYEKEAGPDDAIGEGAGTGQGKTFPHPFNDGKLEPNSKYYESVAFSPFASDLLVELALAAVRAEHLGQREAPDVLCVSFSSNDLIGHNWGPDSQEVLDATLRSDRNVATLLDALDQTVGAGNYVVAVSADHGVCPIPAQLQAKGVDAGLLFAGDLTKKANAYLNQKYKPSNDVNWISAAINSWVAVDRAPIKTLGLNADDVISALADWLAKQPGIEMAVTRRELVQEKEPTLQPSAESRAGEETKAVILEMIRRSYRPDRAGDIAVIPRPHYFFAFALTGTSHGTPHDYDTHVPLVLFGTGVTAAVSKELVAPQSLAPTLLQLLELPKPATVDADALKCLANGVGK